VNNHPGGSMVFTDISSTSLPVGDALTKIEVTVIDGLGGEHTEDIATVGGSVTLSNGQGGLVLDISNPNRTYTIKAVVYSNLCPDGVTFVYVGRYTFDL
jgi:hypothetical protein